ncbi:MAG: Flp pilus assembly protein CpaB [Chloroflexi bacterium]|nr:Flp pilus assembly protein CpaB [Chloroflexota bacterium]
MKRINLLLVGLGLILAISSGGLAMVFLQGAAQQTDVAPSASSHVLVATKDIPEFAIVTAERISARELTTARPPRGALGVPEEAIGRIALTRIRAGEVLLGSKLGEPGASSAAAAMPAPAANEAQRVLYALPATDLLAQSGALGRGDRVDVLVSAGREPVTQVLIKDLLVLGVGRWGASGEIREQLGSMPVVYLLVTPQEALVLKHVRDTGGSLDLVLRAVRDNRDTPTEPVDKQYLFSQFGVGSP